MEKMICNEDMKTAFWLSSPGDSHHDTLRSVPLVGGSGWRFRIDFYDTRRF